MKIPLPTPLLPNFALYLCIACTTFISILSWAELDHVSTICFINVHLLIQDWIMKHTWDGKCKIGRCGTRHLSNIMLKVVISATWFAYWIQAILYGYDYNTIQAMQWKRAKLETALCHIHRTSFALLNMHYSREMSTKQSSRSTLENHLW